MKICLVTLVLLGLLVFAQDADKATEQEPEVKEDSFQAEEIQPDEFVYRPMGRRDPFWDLLKGKNVRGKREAREGIAGLMIDELELEAVVFADGKYRALLSGPDNEPYDVFVGTNVYDGVIVKIDIHSVVFKKILTIALGGSKEKLIVKRLNPDEEVQQK